MEDKSGEVTSNKRSRKRVRCEGNWKQNIRYRKRQSGEEYEDAKGKCKRKREIRVKKDCGKCKYRCTAKFKNKRVFFRNF